MFFNTPSPKRLLLSAIIFISAFAMVSITAKADAVVIDFESVPDSTAISSQYPGATFSNATILTAGISLNEFEFPPRSGSNVVFDDGGAMSITFASPVTSVSGYFTHTTQLTITAYNSSNSIIGTLASAFSNNTALSGDAGSSSNEFLSFSVVSGISRITITGDPFGGSFTLDDLAVSRTSAVPEPSSIALALMGSGGVLFPLRKSFFSRRKVCASRPQI